MRPAPRPIRQQPPWEACLLARLRVLMTPSLIEMRRLDWETPASLLQRVAVLEKVHPIESIEQLRDRLDEDRAAFALFHPGMDDEPLAFVWVAFTPWRPRLTRPDHRPGCAQRPAEKADTAVFWSISASQTGCPSLGLGNELIKAAVRAACVAALVEHLRHPVADPNPGRSVLGTVADGDALGTNRSVDDVQRLLTDEVWLVSHEADELASPLLGLAARYLTDTGATGRSPDPSPTSIWVTAPD
nr:malonyl-CoA decarboxylase family protein [Candidatus Microthrix sp.]